MIKYNSSIFIILSLILISCVLISCEEKDNSEIIKQIELFENAINENKKEITINLDEIGLWNNGKINDKGEIIFSDGRVYSGEWMDGEPNGTGKITIPDLYYAGYMIIEDDQESNNKNGTTEITIDYGLVNNYRGEWKDGKRHGFGKTTWATEDYYEGEYKNDIKNGKGVLNGQNWGEYDGGWKNNKTHGEGTLTLLDGEKWIGEFKEGEISKITVYDKDGKISKGNVYGLIAITRLLDATPYADGAYEITAAKGERMGLDIIYEMEW